MTEEAGGQGVAERRRDADRTRADILAVATTEFADHGFSGARVDEIAARTRTTKRMIYYYFGSKRGLYLAVLENAYAGIRGPGAQLEVEHLDPARAMRALAELTFDHHESHPDFVRLVSIENIHRAEHLRTSEALAGLAAPAVDVLGGILARGHAAGLFRADVDALDVHMVISAFCVFRTREPAHLPGRVRPGPPRPRPARALPAHGRRPRPGVPDCARRTSLIRAA